MTSLEIASEAQEQRALVKWISYHPLIANYFCKNNNEGKRTNVQGYNLKLLGLRAGVSDILIYYPTNTYAGLWLEMKRNKKYTKSERSTSTWILQEKFQEQVKSVGYDAHFCYGWLEGKNIIQTYLLS